MTEVQLKKTRKRRKRKKNYYFTQVHEDAIVEYAKITCNKRRTVLYVEFIRPAFDEMVNKIIFTYRFTTLPNIDSLRQECKVWLTTILDKYDPSKGSKAFSYFSVVTKNWFIHKVKQNARRNKKEIFISGCVSLLLSVPALYFILTQNYKDDLLNGTWKTFTQSGEAIEIGNYLYGLKEGEWIVLRYTEELNNSISLKHFLNQSSSL